MAINRDERLKDLFREDVANRSVGAAIAFAFLSILIFFYHFGITTYAPVVKGASALMLASSVLRLLASKSYLRRPDNSAWKGIQLSVWLNSLAWAIIFGFSTFELKNNGLDYAVLVTIMTGVMAGSLVTLSNSKSLYLPFMIACLGPMLVVALFQYFSWKQDAGVYLSVMYLIFFLYQYLQYKKLREIQADRFKGQLKLEESLLELKESQNAFVDQTAKLFHSSKLSALGEMAGGLSHEVNNSLMTIMGSIEQLDRYFHRDHIENVEYKRKIQNSKEAINQIKTVIDGLRFFSQQTDEAEKVDRPLEEIIQRTLNFCNEMIKANEITMIIAPVPPILVHCNPMQITQILFYLTKNAFDALEGVDDPMKRWIRISFAEKEHDVEIRVMNGGPQISPDVKSRLFQPFFTTKEVGKGTGLSLSISKGIALAHQGDIYLDDNSEWTTFALKIPAAPMNSNAHA